MKNTYLIAIRNAMFWHFSSSEIRDTMEELNMYFETAMQEGKTEQEIISEYGEPKEFVRELRDQQEHSQNKVVAETMKKALFLLALVGMIAACVMRLNDTSAGLFAICCFVLFWMLSGNADTPVAALPNQKYKIELKRYQIGILLLFICLQVVAAFIVPWCANNEIVPLMKLGKYIEAGVMFAAILLIVIAFCSCKKMLSGNVYLYGCVIQSIMLLYGLAMYLEHLKQLVDTDKNKLFVCAIFVVFACFGCILWL